MTAAKDRQTILAPRFDAICELFCSRARGSCARGTRRFSDTPPQRRAKQSARPCALDPLPGRRLRDPELARDRCAGWGSSCYRAAVQRYDALQVLVAARRAWSRFSQRSTALVECGPVQANTPALVGYQTRLLVPWMDPLDRHFDEFERGGAHGGTDHRANRETPLRRERRRLEVEAADRDAFRPALLEHDLHPNSKSLLGETRREQLRDPETRPIDQVGGLILHPIIAETRVERLSTPHAE
jgi:hypothetical protein